MNTPPKYLYRPGVETVVPERLRGSPARIIAHGGRAGLNFTGIRGRLVLPEHTLNEPEGSALIWVLSLDDLFPAAQHAQHKVSNRQSDKFVFLSDREAVREVDGAFFTLCYHSYWHPVFYAKFFTGPIMQGVWAPKPKACAMAGHFELERMQWYQLAVTWNHAAGRYRVYANGVLVAAEDASAPRPFDHDRCGPLLYAGNPALAFSEFAFFDQELAPGELRERFAAEATGACPELQGRLERHWGGTGLPQIELPVGAEWRETLALPLNRAADLEKFFHQGGTPTVQTTGEGLRITTPGLDQFFKNRTSLEERHDVGFDMTRMYLWSHQVFEGDIHASFEFKLHQHGGLCLFMAQAAGMQGEDFLEDYFLRADGRMITVCWEDVRNYHWEFYREICDVRNDVVSHAMLKNPWYRPMAFQVEDRQWELERWYRLDFFQQGARIRGAIDGVQVIDVTDSGFDNNGPVLRRGRVCIRCMMRTDMTVRNLSVRERPGFASVPVGR
jgi:Domain of unknown function (DUF1961)